MNGGSISWEASTKARNGAMRISTSCATASFFNLKLHNNIKFDYRFQARDIWSYHFGFAFIVLTGMRNSYILNQLTGIHCSVFKMFVGPIGQLLLLLWPEYPGYNICYDIDKSWLGPGAKITLVLVKETHSCQICLVTSSVGKQTMAAVVAATRGVPQISYGENWHAVIFR